MKNYNNLSESPILETGDQQNPLPFFNLSGIQDIKGLDNGKASAEDKEFFVVTKRPQDTPNKTEDAEIVCLDPMAFSQAVSYHKDAAKYINEDIAQYETLFQEGINEQDFQYLRRREVSSLRRSYSEAISKRVGSIRSASIRELDSRAYQKDGSDFFNGLANSQFFPGHTTGVLEIDRIRLIDGRAVFDQTDEQKLLLDKFSLNLSAPEYKELLAKFQMIKTAYDDFVHHLLSSKDVIKINPKYEKIFGDRGLISIDFETKEMMLNFGKLTNRRWVD